MADIDRRDMGSAALQQHLREAAGRGADVERLAAGGIEAEMVEPGNQLQRRARDIGLRRIVDGDDRSRAKRPGRACARPRRRRVTVPRSTASRARERLANRPRGDEEFVEPLARVRVMTAEFIGLHWRKRGGKASAPEGEASKTRARTLRSPTGRRPGIVVRRQLRIVRHPAGAAGAGGGIVPHDDQLRRLRIVRSRRGCRRSWRRRSSITACSSLRS